MNVNKRVTELVFCGRRAIMWNNIDTGTFFVKFYLGKAIVKGKVFHTHCQKTGEDAMSDWVHANLERRHSDG